MMVSRSLPWLTRRWVAHVKRARDAGAIAVCFDVPEPAHGFLLVELEPAARLTGLRVLARDDQHLSLGGPL
jgi:hypothetical protein